MILGVGSWRGVGATTTAVAIAAVLAARGEQPWLVEADPAGGVLAARFSLPPPLAGALESLAFPTVRGGGIERFTDAALDVSGIHLITAPGDPFRAWGCHSPRFAWQTALRHLEGPVVIDLGRLRGHAPHTVLLQQLDMLLLVTNPDAVSIVGTLEWAASRGRAAPDDLGLALDITRVAVVDAPMISTRVTRTDVDAELGERGAGWLPWSPGAVELMHRGAGFTHKRLRRHALVQGADDLVTRLHAGLHDERVA